MNAPAKVTGPSIRRGSSKQDYQTPPDFLEAVAQRFGPIYWDLAATADNAVGGCYYGPDQDPPEEGSFDALGHYDRRDALALDWNEHHPGGGVMWLNPPFENIGPWAEKCKSVRWRPGWTLMLTPASIGTDWFRQHVKDRALVLGLSPRIKFVGETQCYPKDLMLSCFGFGARGFDTWRWQTAEPKPAKKAAKKKGARK